MPCPIFQSANPKDGKERLDLDYILTKQADRQLVRCVNVYRSHLEAPKADHNLVYATIRIPRRSAPNRRRMESTKEILRTTDLRRLRIDPNFRRQVANARITALTPIYDDTWTSDIANDIADVMLPTAAELAPRPKHPRVAQDWCAGSGVETEMSAT